MTRRAPGERKPGEYPARAITLAESIDIDMERASEAKFQDWIIKRAVGYQWDPELIYHTRFSIDSPAGFPDLVLAKGARTIFWEVKAWNGKPTPKQEKWIAALQVAGQEARFVWPKDWREVDEELSK